MIDLKLHRFTLGEGARLDRDLMCKHFATAHALGVGHFGLIVFILQPAQPARVAHLTTGFAVKGCLVQHDPAGFTLAKFINLSTVLYERQHLTLGFFCVIAQEIRCTMGFGQVKPDRRIRRFTRS